MASIDEIQAGEDMEFRVRPLEERDLAALEWEGTYLCFRRLFHQAFEDMCQGKRLLLVLERASSGEIIGQIFIQWNSSDPKFADGRGRGYLYSLRVKPAFRGRGLGTRLIRAAETALQRKGMQTASIGVEITNLRARNLYERLGYRVMAEDPGRWSYVDHLGKLQEVTEPAFLLEKNLTQTPRPHPGRETEG